MSISVEGGYLIQLLSSVLHGSQPPQPTAGLDWGKLYRVAAFHRVTAMASYAIDRLPIDEQPGSELLGRFRTDRSVAVAREANQHVHLEQLLEALRSSSIACLPLKGCILKELYPSAEMRFMVDVDLLIDDQQIEEVKGIMSGLGYELRSQGETHDLYLKPPFMTVEIHRQLMPERVTYRNYFQSVWSRVGTDDRRCYLSDEDFYIYLIAHLAKHWTSGGMGIRSIMDVWLYTRRYRELTHNEYTRAELQSIGLRTFAENVERLGQVWFGDEPGDQWHEEMTDFVIASGSAGTRQNAIIMEAAKDSKDEAPFALARCASLLRLLFPPLKMMWVGYPYLHRLPVLLPLAWVCRGVKSVLIKGKNTAQVLGRALSVTESEIAGMRTFHKKMGLTDR
ncbi:MAG: nucleotidyltransferase family protein [Bacillota bacterium]